jgi:hypothetical protein
VAVAVVVEIQRFQHLVVQVAVRLLVLLVICLEVLEILHQLHHLKATTEVQVALTLVLTMPLVAVVLVQ